MAGKKKVCKKKAALKAREIYTITEEENGEDMMSGKKEVKYNEDD